MTDPEGSAAQRPALPPPNPLLGATVDDEPAVPLVATCGATLTDPITPSVTHTCSRVDDHRSSPVGQHWDHATNMTWPVSSAAPTPWCPTCHTVWRQADEVSLKDLDDA